MLGKLFGSDKVIEKGLDLIDDMWTSGSEEAEDQRLMIAAKTKAKTDLMAAYAPFKLAQRWIAFGFTFMFLFIMANGILGSLYGVIDLANVQQARDFADGMHLGEIVFMITTFYFGGGVIESFNRGKKK